jgi:hypothetical protein
MDFENPVSNDYSMVEFLVVDDRDFVSRFIKMPMESVTKLSAYSRKGKGLSDFT